MCRDNISIQKEKGEGLCPLLSIFFFVSFIERQSRVL